MICLESLYYRSLSFSASSACLFSWFAFCIDNSVSLPWLSKSSLIRSRILSTLVGSGSGFFSGEPAMLSLIDSLISEEAEAFRYEASEMASSFDCSTSSGMSSPMD